MTTHTRAAEPVETEPGVLTDLPRCRSLASSGTSLASTTQEIPPEVLALLVLPDFDTLTSDQVRGAVCVWGTERLTTETSVDLGEQTGEAGHWWPRACHQHAGVRAYLALYAHVALCEPCVDDVGQCETGRALSRLIRRYRR
ncbi:hypothetical protein [Streptomyces sp. NPDC006134]|uniref:hypothetical protein n=1 Tax=Streptomyces sp. NPDC006134 TaxID=3154467 RepID=UPI0033FDCA12